MNSDTVIRAERLGKKYIIGHESQPHRYRGLLRDVISHKARNFTRKFVDMLRGRPIFVGDSTEEFWALKDVSFEIKRGEMVGIIGRNGAGKSTLLKILSRITEPTEGRVTIEGRVASLLEVGTGFHGELTGRENIYLNGAILGMRRAEIRRKFDEIVAFAEIEKFLDTPVKRYSSGMYVRLAFAVAAHLEPEILVVDEVLAVGDAEFQKKCLGRMHSVASEGRTVIFVSHNMASIEELCERAVVMKTGRVEQDGPARTVISHYLRDAPGRNAFEFDGLADREGSGHAVITSVDLLSADGATSLSSLAFYQPFRVRIHYTANQPLEAPKFGLAILSQRGERLVLNENTEAGVKIDRIQGHGYVDCLVRNPNLLPGEYYLELWIVEIPNVLFADHLHMVASFRVDPDPERSRASSAALAIPNRGSVFFDCDWAHHIQDTRCSRTKSYS
jgi:homopolymeric O-antigen transport system ATP-binding protein